MRTPFGHDKVQLDLMGVEEKYDEMAAAAAFFPSARGNAEVSRPRTSVCL